MKTMKKLLILLLAFASALTFYSVEAQVTYLFEITNQEFGTYDGVSHTYKEGLMTYGTDQINVQYNILEFDTTKDNLHLVTVSDYSSDAWGMSPLTGMILRYQRENPHVEVLAGINGDFYDINNTGHPSGVYIENYEVIKGTPASGRYVFNIREDGTYDIDRPVLNGYEVLIIDKYNEVKYRGSVKVNDENINENDVFVYSNRFRGELNLGNDALLIETSNIKHLPNLSFQFAKGQVTTEGDVNAPTKNQVSIVGSIVTNLITDEDTVIVQGYIPGYEDVRGTMGGGVKLVDNGVPTTHTDPYRHPRTAIGIREDGSVFFFNNHGRMTAEAVPGLRYVEMGKVLEELGAVEAINIDGGGSSTMVVKNEYGEYVAINNLSDGRMRSISNGILLVRGDIKERPVYIEGEDNRPQFEQVKNFHIDQNNVLSFSPVTGANRYIVEVGLQKIETSVPHLNLSFLDLGEHTINVYVKGNYDFKMSEASEDITFMHHGATQQELMECIKNFTKNNN